MAQLLRMGLNLLYPPRCPYCRGFLDRDALPGCPACLEKLPRTEDGGIQTGAWFSFCAAPFYYEGTVRESLLRFKFHHRGEYAKRYAPYLADCIRACMSGRYDLICWVPISKKRLRERGYDQDQLLAHFTSGALGQRSMGVLKKIRDTPPQSGMDSAELRRKNVEAAYRVPEPELVRGKRVLLIDDIITTGSTLSECAGTLRAAGAAEVLCATFARAGRHGMRETEPEDSSPGGCVSAPRSAVFRACSRNRGMSPRRAGAALPPFAV